MRILLGSDYYPPFVGGAHRQTQLLGQELLRRGHQVDVASVWHPGFPAEEDDNGVRVHRLKQLRTVLPWPAQRPGQRHQPPFADPVTTLQMRRVIRRVRPDVVHSYGWFTYSVAAALLGTSIPLLVTARDYGYACATRTLVERGAGLCSGPSPLKCLACSAQLYGIAKGWTSVLGVALGRPLLLRKMSGMHSISAYVQEMLHRDLLPEGTAQANRQGHVLVEAVIPSFQESNGDDPGGDDAQLRGHLDRLPQEGYMLFVGALRRVKGIDQLLAAYQRLVSPPPLVLLGTFEADSPRTYPPGVLALGDFPHRAVLAAWDRSLFGVVPSLLPEPLGSVVYEGMSRGKAVIGTRPGGHTDMVVDGETGLLVPQGDVDALAGAMQTLIDDGDLRERLGKAARQRARVFTAGTNVPRFEQLYRDLVAERVK